MTDVDVLVTDDATPIGLPPNGYVVTHASGDRVFRCGGCVCCEEPQCPCIFEALAYSRKVGPGARVMRGKRCLAFVTQRTYAVAMASAEAANARSRIEAAP